MLAATVTGRAVSRGRYVEGVSEQPTDHPNEHRATGRGRWDALTSLRTHERPSLLSLSLCHSSLYFISAVAAMLLNCTWLTVKMRCGSCA